MTLEERLRQIETLTDETEREDALARAREKVLEIRHDRRSTYGQHPNSIGLWAKDFELLNAGLITVTPAVEATGSPGTLIMLSGGPGTGKTTAAAAWLYRWVTGPESWNYRDDYDYEGSRPGTAHFITAAKLARVPHYDAEKVETLFEHGRLVIDDLGVEYLDEKGFYLSLFDELLNERYAHRRPTMLTTNLTAEAFKGRYGERIADRIREAGRFVALGNKSMRRKDAA